MDRFRNLEKLLIISFSTLIIMGFQNCADTSSNKSFYTSSSAGQEDSSISNQSRGPAQSGAPSENPSAPSN